MAALVVGGAAFALVPRSSAHRASAPPTTLGTNAGPGGEFVTFTDPDVGVTISYPKTWTRITTKPGDPSVRLVVEASALDSLLVRVVTLEKPVTAANLGDIKSVTDAIVSGTDVKILQQRSITLNGLPGYYYLYTFKDAGTGQEGVHAHYFIFQGRKMNILVFQALPSGDFSGLASTFDRIASSFASRPDTGEAPTAAPSTTAGP